VASRTYPKAKLVAVAVAHDEVYTVRVPVLELDHEADKPGERGRVFDANPEPSHMNERNEMWGFFAPSSGKENITRD